MSEIKSQSSASRDRIIHIAHSLFVEQGYVGVSMQQIGDAAGITKATLYHHFRDKQDLYLETMRVAFEAGHAAMRHEIGQHTAFADQLRGIITFVLGNRRTDLQRLTADFKRHMDSETQCTFWNQFETPWSLLKPAIEDAIERGEIRDQDSTFLARYIYSLTIGVVQLRRMDTDVPYSEDVMIDMLIDTIMNGIASR